ncbi:calcium-binding protein [Sulfurospirillum sp.]|uniref:calcium-binding protein n=1 Tax=Sulfurospirillum sp. TaxID=2053622 RepID=UPI002FDCC86B
MALSNLHTNYKSSYKDDLINLTKAKENPDLLKNKDLSTNLNAQVDKTANSIALGYGYDLFQNYSTITSDLSNLASSATSNLSNEQAIQAVKDLIGSHRVKVDSKWQFKADGDIDSLKTLQDRINSTITLSTEQNATTLMTKELDAMQDKVVAKTGLGESNELISLVDMAFNGGIGLIGPKLTEAIANDDRVAAWYEIKYDSNKANNDVRSFGLQNRRDAQSDLFGLYSSADGKIPTTAGEANRVITFLESMRSKIIDYLNHVKNDAGEVKGNIADLNNALSAAETFLTGGSAGEIYTYFTADKFQLSADYFKITIDELLKTNPNLFVSEDKSFYLLKEGEKLYLPEDYNFDHTSLNPYDFNLTSSYFFQRRDPLALDTNKDGFIATTSVTESETYFDLTGDGIKERTGWIKGEDALLVYDANEDGQVGGISEVFGNVTTEGFDELRDTIDSNYDNKIDRKDILFNRLQLWHDYDQDGSVDEGELKSLKEEGITSIDLNSVQTNINTNGNVITEASHYTTATGEKELIADVHLQYDARDTIIDLVQQEDFTIDPTTLNLPNLRGYGLVVDSFIAYQTNENLATLAKQYATDEQLISNDFDEYINEWSGYNAYKETIAKKYNLSADVDMSDLDRKIWIMEKFSGKEELTSRIESNYEANAKAVTGTKDVTVTSINGQNRLILASDYINTQYNSMLHRTQSEFAIQSVFENVFTGVSYSVDTDSLKVTDATKLQQSLTNYLNDASIDIDSKVFLAQTIWMLNTTKSLTIDAIALLATITDSMSHDLIQQTMTSGIDFTGSKGDDKLEVTGNSLVLGNSGNDIIQSHDSANQTYLFRKGDGKDILFDAGGNDTLRFDKDIIKDDIVLSKEGFDLLLSLKDSTDSVRVKDWFLNANRIENIVLGDGIALNVTTILQQFSVTENADVIDLDNQDNTIDALGGNDTVRSFGGNDTLSAGSGNDSIYAGSGDDKLYGNEGNDVLSADSGDDKLVGNEGDDTLDAGIGNDTLTGGVGADTLYGGSGNDLYLYSKGDGKDILSDESGEDTLRFSEGITKDDLIAKANGNDLIIGIKEEGKTFDQLTDTVTIKNYLSSGKLEHLLLNDGTSLALDELQRGSEESDYLVYGNEASTVNALDGNDTIITGSGADIIDGGSGNDTISVGGGNDSVSGRSGNDVIDAGDGANVVDGGEGNDTISAGSGNDTLNGDSGNDSIVAGSGVDVITGGLGDDVLQGGLGNDTYLFNKGDGKDTIDDTYRYGYNNQLSQYAGEDTLKFGEGITKNDLVVLSVGSDVIIGIKEEGKSFAELSDKITLKNYTDSDSRVENILFADGSKFLISDLFSATEGADQLIYGDTTVMVDALGGNDTIVSGNGNDVIAGGEGNDAITSNSGNDTLGGGAGDDALYSGSGDDILSGGTGVDNLQGGLGSDTYLFSKGDGKDSIYDDYRYSGNSQGNAGLDTLKFSEGITKDDLVIRLNGNDLIIGIKEEGKNFEALSDTVTIKEYFNTNNRIEKIQLSDCTFVSLEELQQGTDGDDVLTFNDENTTINALGGNDKITTGAGNDIIDGGSGNDTIYSHAGADTITAGSGNDSVYAGSGDDKLYGNEGNDVLSADSGDDKLVGNEGDDTLDAGIGNDTLTGGVGADTLYGGSGNDLYLYSKGDGKDILSDESGEDTLRFSEGITKDDLIAKANGNDLIIGIKEEGKTFDQLTDTVTIKNYLSSGKLEHLLLNDGTSLALDELQRGSEESDYLVYGNEASTVNALDGNDTIITGSGADIIDGGSGNDTITSGSGADKIIGGLGDDVINAEGGDDVLFGNEGADILQAGSGEDTLTGGTGDDSLYGGLGNDTYIFNKGDGKDRLSDEGGVDAISFGTGIAKENLIFKQVGYDLVVAVKEAGKTFSSLGDKLTISNYFKDTNTIETLKFADGTQMTNSEVAALFVNVNIEDTIFSKQGAVLRGGNGDDVYVYNQGDFTVVIDDYYYKDGLEVNAGKDTLQFATGINKADVTIGVNGTNLIIKINSSETYQELQDIVVIKDWANVNHGIEKIIFSNGEVMDISKTETFPTITFNNTWTSKRYYIYGNDNDEISGTTSADTIEAAGGADVISGGDGNDIIYGQYGDDIIDGGTGDDKIIGGAGADYIKDALGNDVYIFNKGDGRDIIKDSAGTDVLFFGEGVSKDDIVLRVFDNNLAVGLKEGSTSFYRLNDRIILKDWYSNGRIESFKFSDGTTMSSVDIIQSIKTDGNDTINGLDDQNDILNGGVGNDTIDGKNGNDILNGGVGTDVLTGGNGDDTFDGGYGDDTMSDISGNDIYDGGYGNDTINDVSGNDTYRFGKGMGKDVITDNAGLDSIVMANGILKSDVIWQQVGNDLVIGLKEDGKTLDQLIDTITVKNWYTGGITNRVEIVKFTDGSTITSNDILQGTEQDDNLTYGAEDNVVHALGGNDVIVSGAGNDIIYGEKGNDAIVSGGGNDTLYGGDGADALQGQDGNDTLYGGDGNDELYGQLGDDVMDGGSGNDLLEGRSGNDTYLFGRGDGKDLVRENNFENSNYGNDTLKFKEGITADDILIKQVGNNLVIGLKEEGKTFDQLSDTITFENWLAGSPDYYESRWMFNTYYAVENIVFSDGTTWNKADIMAHVGTDDNEIIYALDGADTIHGGKGNDILYGRVGDDTYLFNRGDGKDTIYDSYGSQQNGNNAGNDTLKFGDGITADDFIIQKSGNNVLIGIKEDGKVFDQLSDVITIKDWYNVNNRIEHFVLSDGTKINTVFLFDPTEQDDNLTYGAEDNVVHALGGNDVIVSGAGNDIIYGEKGNDAIVSGGGNDTLYGGDGADALQGQDGNDTLYGGDGNDELYGQLGDDVMDGGSGNDLLEGRSGNDTYLFGRGDGKDLVRENNFENSNYGNDTLKFKEGITADDILIKQVGNNLVIGLKEEGKTFDQLSDTITFENWLAGSPDYYESRWMFNTYYAVENIVFSDGTTWNKADIMAHVGTDDNEIIYALDGADTIHGGKGNDILYGRVGDDTYLFNRGDGKDTIYDSYGSQQNGNNAGNDTLKFGDGITADDIVLRMNGSNLEIDAGNGDFITINSQTNLNNAIEKIVLSDGTYMTSLDIEKLSENLSLYASENGISLTSTDIIRSNGPMMEMIGSYWRGGNSSGGEYTPPIVLDLNGNLKTSIALESSNVYFDYDGNGIKEKTAWAESSDALLSMDLNGDGLINNGGELFGNYTKLADGSLSSDGYTALAQYDSNHDNIIDVNDSAFASLKIWKDANQNGITDAGELTSLQLSDISSIHLTREDGTTFNQITEAGNIISNQTSFTSSSNGSGIVRDVWFKVDKNDTITNNDTFISRIANESFSGGEGNDTYVMKLGGGKDVIDDNDPTGLGIDTIRFASGISADQILVKWDRQTNGLVIGIRENSEDDTALKDLSDQIVVKNWFDATGKIEKFVFADGTALDAQAIYAKLMQTKENGELSATVLASGDSLVGGRYNDVLFGADGNELISGNDGDDFLNGQAGDDQLMGDDGDDVIDGGMGADILMGGNGDDYYIFEKNGAHDLISDSSGIDTLMLGAGIARGDILAKVVGDDIILGLKETGKSFEELSDTITIKNWTQTGFEIEKVILDDGTTLSLDDLRNQAPILIDVEVNVQLQDARKSTGNINVIDPDGDTLTYGISTQASHGKISINANGEWTYQSEGSYNGDDIAIITIDDGNGGVVKQTLRFEVQGYIYEGEDLVIDDTSDTKTLVMNTLSKDDLRFSCNGGDLVITVADTKTITLKNYFTDPQAGVEVLQMAEGTISLSRDAINPIMYGGYVVLDASDHLVAGDNTGNWLLGNVGNDILLGAGGNDYVSGGSGNDLMVGGDGNDNLQGNNGNDAIYGDNGNDQIYAGEGNDILNGGSGTDMLFGENGDDVISGGSGNDTLYAGSGNDTLKSGSGDDFIDGSYGSDTYLFNIGDGADTVVDSSAYGSSDTDKILFGAGITKENLQILRDNYDLVFKVNDNDSMRIKYWFGGVQRNTIEQITFSDGTTLNTTDVNALAITKGTEGSDWLFGIDTLGDNIYGMGGNDGIYSYGGNDVLSGGTGNDFMEGGSGSDTYLFNKGDGKDTINEWASWNSSDVDSVKFGDGITNNDVSFILSGTNLLIQYGQNDTIKVANTYNNTSSSPIERIELSNGSYLTDNDMNLIIQQMSAYAVDKGISLTSNSDIQNNQALMQIVSSGWHNA